MNELKKLDIKKEILKKGCDLNISELCEGSKVIFHFKTYTGNEPHEVRNNFIFLHFVLKVKLRKVYQYINYK